MRDILHVIAQALPFIVAYYIVLLAVLALLFYRESKNQDVGIALKLFTYVAALPILAIIGIIVLVYILAMAVVELIVDPFNHKK